MKWRIGYAPTARGPIQLMGEAMTGERGFLDMIEVAVTMALNSDDVIDTAQAFTRCILAGKHHEFYAWRILSGSEFHQWQRRWQPYMTDSIEEGRYEPGAHKWFATLRRRARSEPRTDYTRTLEMLDIGIASAKVHARPYKNLVVFYLGELDSWWVARCLVRPIRGATSNPRWLA